MVNFNPQPRLPTITNPSRIVGSERDDELEGNFLNNEMYGYGGNDHIIGDSGSDLIYGGAGEDNISGGEAGDSLHGGDDNDSIYGGFGNDEIYGENGNDQLSGEDDNDIIYGGDGNDSVRGGDGDDALLGGRGDDYVSGGRGNDILAGGDGKDFLDYRSALGVFAAGWWGVAVDLTKSGQRVSDDQGIDYFIQFEGIYGSLFNDTLSGDNNANELFGNALNDFLYGRAGNDTLSGGTGNDQLYGDDGYDVLYGNEGDDVLEGGGGSDTLNGGSGIDEANYDPTRVRQSELIIINRDFGDGRKVTYVLNTKDKTTDELTDIESVRVAVTNIGILDISGNFTENYASNSGDANKALVMGYYDSDNQRDNANISLNNLAVFEGAKIGFHKFFGYAKPGFGVFDSNVAPKSFTNKLKNSGFDFGYNIDLKAGLKVDLDLNLGLINGNIGTQLDWAYARSGNQVSLTPSFMETDNSSYSVSTPVAKVLIEAGIWSPKNWAGFHVPVAGKFKTDSYNFSHVKPFVDFDSQRDLRYSYQDDILSASVQLPDLSATSRMSGGKLVSDVESSIASANVDLDALISTFFGYDEGLSIALDLPGGDFNFELLDSDVNISANFHQQISIDLVSMTGNMVMEDGSRLRYQAGNTYNFEQSKYDVDHDGKIEFDYNLRPVLNITNHTYLTLDAGISLDVGIWSYDIDTFVYSDSDSGTLFSDQYNATIATLDLIDINNRQVSMPRITGTASLGDYGSSFA